MCSWTDIVLRHKGCDAVLPNREAETYFSLPATLHVHPSTHHSSTHSPIYPRPSTYLQSAASTHVPSIHLLSPLSVQPSLLLTSLCQPHSTSIVSSLSSSNTRPCGGVAIKAHEHMMNYFVLCPVPCILTSERGRKTHTHKAEPQPTCESYSVGIANLALIIR